MNILTIIQKKDVQRFSVLILLCLILYFLRSMLNLILLTFLMTYLMNRVHRFCERWVCKVIPIHSKAILALIYFALVSLIILVGMNFYPIVSAQITQLLVLIDRIYKEPPNEISGYVMTWLGSLDFPNLAKDGFGFLLKIGNLGVQFFLALMLSMFLLLGKENAILFATKFHTSKIGWFSKEIEYFGKKLLYTFGKVIETQLIIALINCLLTTAALWILGFPNLVGLSLLIFILGLIPVAGVFISLLPLSLIAYNLGGIGYVAYLVVVIMVIHTLEGYVLNPRLMASKTHLPVFCTFLLLLIFEHFFGTWGLIVGIPTFVFLLDILDFYKETA